MNISRAQHLSLLLSLTSACTIDKDLLATSSSSGGASESAEATSAPTTGAPTGGATGGTSTGEPGASTGDLGTSTEVDPGTATTIDIDTDDTGVATTTGDGPDQSELVVFPGGEPMCMPVCVNDEEPETEVIQPNCQVFEIDVDAQTEQPVIRCEELDLEWVIPAGHVRCFAELVDTGNQTLSEADDISETCLATGLNLEFLIVAGEPAPPGVAFGAICELSALPALHCPDA